MWALILILILQYCTFVWLNRLLILARFHCRYLLFISLPFWITPAWVAFPRKRKVLSIPGPESISTVFIATKNCNISVEMVSKSRKQLLLFHLLTRTLH